MPNYVTPALIGVAAGLAAAAVMEGYQTLAAPLFGQGGSSDDSSTVKVADSFSEVTTGEAVTQKRRANAGRLVHYATGGALGGLYGIAVASWPAAASGFGVAYGVTTAVVLDEAIVPALGLAPAPWETPPATHAYGLTAHMVFGAALEGTRRIATAMLPNDS